MPKTARAKKAGKRAKPKATTKRGKAAILERYGTFSTTAQDKQRRELIDWLTDNFVKAVSVFGADVVQRRLYDLRDQSFEFDYDDPND